MKRPCESACRSLPSVASSIGVRAKAIAIAARRARASVVSRAASTSGKKGSCGPSKVKPPS